MTDCGLKLKQTEFDGEKEPQTEYQNVRMCRFTAVKNDIDDKTLKKISNPITLLLSCFGLHDVFVSL